MNYKQKVVKMDKIGTKRDKNIGNWMVTLGSKLPSRLIRIRVVKGRVLPGFHCMSFLRPFMDGSWSRTAICEEKLVKIQ